MKNTRLRFTIRLNPEVVVKANIMLAEASDYQRRDVSLNYVISAYLTELTEFYHALPTEKGRGISLIAFIGKYLSSARLETRQSKSADASE
jgi:hypothetical protein